MPESEVGQATIAGTGPRTPYSRSDHYDGTLFFNPGVPPSSRGMLQVLRWRFREKRTPWSAVVDRTTFPPPPDSVPDGSVAITFINQASFLLRFSSATVLTDPIFSERCSPFSFAGPKRARPPGLALDALPRPDVVLISHNHYDHMDLPSLQAIRKRYAPRFVTTLGNAAYLRRFGIEATELDWWEATEAGPLRVTATPARHFSARTPFDRNRTLWAGFMIGTKSAQVLFAGDSAAGPHWREIRRRMGAPDVALLPIGAYEPRWFMAAAHMNPNEAVDAHLALEAATSVGMHFGTFQLTEEPIDAPLLDLAKARDAKSVPAERFGVHGFGETRVYTPARNMAS